MINTMAKDDINYEELAFDMECPTCEVYSNFFYRGKQTFPAHVAEQLGMPTDIHLWSCSNCFSTISHVDLGIEL